MLSRDVTKSCLSLIKEKIIKTDIVLNIVCEKNATISELQSKLDLVSAKFIDKCEELNILKEEFDSKNKECYIQSTKLIKLQQQHDQLIFDSSYAQTQYNELNNESYLTIQNLESELIKLNAKVNTLKNENDQFKTNDSFMKDFDSVRNEYEGKYKVILKDSNAKIKNLQGDLKESKKLHNNCLTELQAAKEECKRLELVFKNYKNNNGKELSNGKCTVCTTTYEPILYKSVPEVQREKYQKILSQYEELQLIVDTLKNDNIKIAEKYSDLLLQSQSTKSYVNISCQTEYTLKENLVTSPEKIICKRIDADEKIVRIRHLKTDKIKLKEELMKILNQKRVLQTDLNCLSQENRRILDKYEQIKLDRDALLLENQLKLADEIIIETPKHFADNFQSLNQIIKDENEFLPSNFKNIDDLGLHLSSSESEFDDELDSCDNILKEMVKFRQIVSPLPKTPKPLRYNLKSQNTIIKSSEKSQKNSYFNNLDNSKVRLEIKTCDMSKPSEISEISKDNIKLSNNESSQTDFSEIKDSFIKFDFECQTYNILTEERGVQCVRMQDSVNVSCQVDSVNFGCPVDSVNVGCQVDILTQARKISKSLKRHRKNVVTLKRALQIVKQANYDITIKNGNIRQFQKRNSLSKNKRTIHENLKLALETFRRYSTTMTFENGALINVENKNERQINAFNSFLFSKSNSLLKRFYRKYRDLKNAMNIANKRKLNAVIINGIICDNKAIENSKVIDEEIREIAFSNGKIVAESAKFMAIFNGDDNFKGFGDVNTINSNFINKEGNIKYLRRSKQKVRKRATKKQQIIRKQRSIDLRNKFDLELKKLEATQRCINFSLQEIVETKKITNNLTPTLNENKENRDNSSVDFDSGYTDGSETSEINIENIEKRILRSPIKRNRCNSSSSQAVNKRRKLTSKDLFGSDESDCSEYQKDCTQKKSPIRKKSSVLDKMKKIVRTYNPRAQNSQTTNKIIVENNKKIEDIQSVEKKIEYTSENQQNIHKKLKNRRNTFEKIKTVESAQLILQNKDDLMKRFISDIPIIKPIHKRAEKIVFKKPLARRKISTEICEDLIKINDTGKNKCTSKPVLTSEIIEAEEDEEDSQSDDGEIFEQSDEDQNEIISDDEALRLLNNLIQNNCEESVVSIVYKKICPAPTQQISRLIIHLLYKHRSETAEPSHTPLAPSMSPTYKTLIGFTNSLSHGKHKLIFSDLLDQLESKFLLHTNAKINNNATKTVQGVTILSLEQVFRFYVSVCMLKTEVLRLRRFLCDMAYFQRDGFYGLLYSVFTIWPTVLPKNIDEDDKPVLKENDSLLMKVLIFFVFKKRNSDEFMHYRPFLSTFAFGFYKYKSDTLHIKLIFDELIEKFTTLDSDILAYALIILLQRITNVEFLNLLRSESFNNVFKASDQEKLIGKSKLLWLLDRIIPEIKNRGDKKTISGLESILKTLSTRVENCQVKNFIQCCIEKLSKQKCLIIK